MNRISNGKLGHGSYTGDTNLISPFLDVASHALRLKLEVCQPGSAWKPWLGLIFEQLRLHEIEAQASGLMQGRPGAGSGSGRSSAQVSMSDVIVHQRRPS